MWCSWNIHFFTVCLFPCHCCRIVFVCLCVRLSCHLMNQFTHSLTTMSSYCQSQISQNSRKSLKWRLLHCYFLMQSLVWNHSQQFEVSEFLHRMVIVLWSIKMWHFIFCLSCFMIDFCKRMNPRQSRYKLCYFTQLSSRCLVQLKNNTNSPALHAVCSVKRVVPNFAKKSFSVSYFLLFSSVLENSFYNLVAEKLYILTGFYQNFIFRVFGNFNV